MGGFGVGSDFTWSTTALLGFDFTLFEIPMTLYGGYRAIGQDFEDGGFEWDMVLHGPLFGVTTHF